jgi:hypothetical protein
MILTEVFCSAEVKLLKKGLLIDEINSWLTTDVIFKHLRSQIVTGNIFLPFYFYFILRLPVSAKYIVHKCYSAPVVLHPTKLALQLIIQKPAELACRMVVP